MQQSGGLAPLVEQNEGAGEGPMFADTTVDYDNPVVNPPVPMDEGGMPLPNDVTTQEGMEGK